MSTKKITFTVPSETAGTATGGLLLGDFNNWLEEQGINLKKQKDGSLKATVDLAPGVYQYRYFLNDGRWVNDGNANGYSYVGAYGVDNCVITVEHDKEEVVAKPVKAAEVPVATKKAAAKKAAPKAEPVKEVAKPAAKKVEVKKEIAKPAAKKAVAKPVATKTTEKPAAKKTATKAAPAKATKKAK